MQYLFSILLTVVLSAHTLFAAEQVTFYHTDLVGTPLAISDSTGAVVWQADYKPFGEEHTVAGTAENKRRFVGKEKDTESGFSYFDARYEDAKTGRFISVDPVGAVNPQNSKTNEELLGNPQRLNSYSYGLNNPYKFVDEDGKVPLPVFYAIGGLAIRASQSPAVQRGTTVLANNVRQVATLVSRFGEVAKNGISKVENSLSLETSVHRVMGNSYKAIDEVSVAIKNRDLVNALNSTSKGDWVKVYEAGVQNASKLEVHYFRNNSTGQVFDVKPKYNYWHQNAFKNIGEK